MPGPHLREGYNSKARQSTAGSRKKGKLKKVSRSEAEKPADCNAAIITTKTKEEKEIERREKLLQELASQSESKWTSKKKKRLEKYIDKKIKKEERLVIFDKLVKTQASLSTSVLQSSSTLGTGKASTFQERQEKDEDIFVKKSLLGQSGKRKRHQDIFDVQNAEGEEDLADGLLSGQAEEDTEFQNNANEDYIKAEVGVIQGPPSLPPKKSTQSAPSVGSALQRNANGGVTAPKVRPKSKGKYSVQRGWGTILPPSAASESDTSFDSSDSESVPSNDERGEELDSESEEDIVDGSTRQPQPLPLKKKSLGFKEWAVKQLGIAKGYELSPNNATEEAESVTEPPKKKRKLEGQGSKHEIRGPLGENLELPSTTFAKRFLDSSALPTSKSYIKVIDVKRPPEVEEARVLLPIVTEEQPIMEAIMLNPVVIICGETGSGKTTQVPQFLFEAGFGSAGSENPGMIGITQPRRVAAVSMAARVGHELSLTSSRVSYQIRYDATVSPSTSIKFMTDGVLLRELATDFLLTKYSVIIVDEAHERSINTDILIGVLSRIIKLRENMWQEGKENIKPLRLIIMSATLRVSDFAENKTLFTTPPPVINVAARQHPVTIHFSRRTYPDYVTQAIKKTTKIHTRLPPGGILIFLTGQAEIAGVCRKLEAKFGRKAISEKQKRRGQGQPRRDNEDEDVWPQPDPKQSVNFAQAAMEAEDVDLGQDNLAFDVDGNMDGDADSEALESDDEDQLDTELGLDEDSNTPMHIVPLYSLLPSDKQMRVFQPPPPDCRLVVVSTNIAETSLTIPGIRYVVDCGRAKERHYDVTNGIQSFQVSWIAKASAAQRAGRAGRTGPGHCYRLYSSALFEHHFEKFSIPEIQRMPIEGVVLQMKSMHIDTVINFPFPTPPDHYALQKSERILTYLGALAPAPGTSSVITKKEGQITDLGRAMALFPLSPRFSRMLVSGQQHGCLPYVICIVSALSVGDPFIYEDAIGRGDDMDIPASSGPDLIKSQAKEERQQLRKAFFQSQHVHSSLGKCTSDLFKLLSVVGAYEYAGGGQKFCAEHFVRPKAMEEIHKLRAQISSIVHSNFPTTDPGFTPKLSPPSDHQVAAKHCADGLRLTIV
ncbi:hypothetical protein M413DRAFT_444160 [Hebeloma cylindrosporum]|uniref:RNA helicase n=1 Tax=Hebeloma cylindrosporum TaxID=76867 RepID=A0A0C3CGP1_HEBCY|nr:hypothetical protein M413DRAFT_444160 [Hebeloma cylindrosporum h7]